jgi:hypothetical protein
LKKWILSLTVLGAFGIYFFAKNESCSAHLTVLNASGKPVKDLHVKVGETEYGEGASILSPGAEIDFEFLNLSEGPYSIRFIDGNGTTINDDQGYLVTNAAFNDTLIIHPDSGNRLSIQQSTSVCQEPFHWRAFIRRLLRSL